MNYYQYKKRVPEARKKSDYIKPFLAVLVFIGVIFALWKLLGAIFGGDEETVDQKTKELVNVVVETGSAKVKTASAEDWETIQDDGLKVYAGEKVQTLSDGRLSLEAFDGTVLRLDKQGTLAIDTLEEGTSRSEVAFTLSEGNAWVDLTKLNSVSSEVTVKTDTFNAIAGPEARFALAAPDSLYVLSGEVQAEILDGSDVLKTITVDKGEQLVVTSSVVSDLSKGLDKDILFKIDDNFKTSSWYRWNQQKDGGSSSEDEVVSEDEDSSTSDDKDKEEDEKADEEDTSEGPDTPKITSPGKNGGEVTLEKKTQLISGTVADDVEKVIVNDYELQQYEPGSGKFTYKASYDLKNLKKGENIFKVIAVDEDGKKSEPATITLILPESVIGGEEEDQSGEVTITSPNNGKDLTTSETSFVISGSVPSETATVKVNNYQLQGFKAGATTYKYNANTTLGTLKADQKNTFLVEAFDEDGKKLGSASMTIDVSTDAQANASEPAAEAAPFSATISLPTTASTYETTLNQITLGGTVTGSPEAVYVNGNAVENYTPGSGKWSLVVTLTPGTNAFNVYSEKEGKSSAADSLTVNFKE